MTNPEWTILTTLRWTTDYFRDKGVSEPRTSAEVLLAHALGLSRLDLYLRYDQPLSAEELARFKALVLRRRQGEPVAYLTGHKEFWSLDFQVGPGVLIPRPETEILVASALEAAREIMAKSGEGVRTEAAFRLGEPSPSAISGQGGEEFEGKGRSSGPWAVEIGVGSGAVVVALAKELPPFNWLALDLSAAALAVARDNARRHEVADRLHFVQGDLLGPLKPEAQFALVVANLPYVPRRVWEELPKDIKEFEPPEALLGGEDGLKLIKILVREAPRYLQPRGCLALEVADGQAGRVLELLRETGAYERLETLPDYQGIQRVVRARLAAP
jgi:release factor glutamine methyltransferase